MRLAIKEAIGQPIFEARMDLEINGIRGLW